ncbi:MAG: iron export ABC transporter permease subunit FetB [Gammaproteobacteria bacterium]|nr:iron export ABC transporter permease subunit FetB [Gammaproteobacteria bacterium]
MQPETLISLTPFDLALAAGLVLAVAALSWRLRLDIGRRMLIASLRSTLQLLLLGLVLKTLFHSSHPGLVAALATLMLGVAGYEVMARQKHPLRGFWGFGTGTVSMFLSSFSITLLALLTVLQPTPWYTPQYAIPLLGMLLGNTMTGIAVALDNLTRQTVDKRQQIEARLALGQTAADAIGDIRRDALRAGLIPIVNSMATAGIVSLPGMMTGQILAGSPPMEAAKYQLLILFLIAAGTGFGSVVAVMVASHRLFDVRARLRRDRLRN